MFTSRAEYRLRLRADNADQRLTPLGVRMGCVGRERAQAFHVKQRWLEEARARASHVRLSPTALAKRGIAINQDGVARSALDLLAYRDIDWRIVARLWPELGSVPADIAEQLAIDARYGGYLLRQERDIAAYRRDEALALSADLDYDAIGSLSSEIRQKLRAHSPTTLGQASRISGMTPAALVALLKYVRRQAA